MDGYDSDGSSLLSSPKSPTPPPEMQKNPYPSPPRSKHSSQSASPSPDDQMDPSDNPRPAKRRRISEKPERTTEYLDLSKGLRPDEKTQLDRILNVLHKRQKIVVVAGAGISVSAGSKSTHSFLISRQRVTNAPQSPISVRQPVFSTPSVPSIISRVPERTFLTRRTFTKMLHLPLPSTKWSEKCPT